MTYDLLIKNGRVVDGTGVPAFNADVGIRHGKIADIGRLRGSAARTIDAKGQVVAPGFIDSHTHFDAQVTWDPLCTWSCYHGVTTVITGNCSLGIAPLRPGTMGRVYEFLSYVEAIPMETLMTVKPAWQTFGEYLDVIDRGLGVNVGALVGHTPIRYFVMGEDCQGRREPTAEELGQMKDLVRDAMQSGALGLSFSLNRGHYDPHGVNIPAVWAKEEELFALAEVLGELGTGILQLPSCNGAQEKNRLMSRLSEKTGRPVIYGQLAASVRRPDYWKFQIEVVEESVKQGLRAIPVCSPTIMSEHFDMHNCQIFKGVPTWHPVMIASDEEKMKAYRDAAFRKKVHHETIEWPDDMDKKTSLGRNWIDVVWLRKVKLEKNKKYRDMSLRELAQATGKGIIDAFLDLVVEEQLDTHLEQGRRGFDPEVMSKILNYPNALIGLADSGAHVQFHCGYGYATFLLSHWVRKHKIMSVEAAVKKLTFDQAQAFGIYDRGLLRPGMAADIVIFDPETIRSTPVEKVTDLPGGAWRLKEMAEGVMCTIVNGEVLIDDGKPTGALPGRVLRNSLYPT
jgi:N-acyl-D-amino-acid deacylase